MADLQITVFRDAKDVALGLPLQEEIVNIGLTSTPSNILTPDGRKVRRVRIFADADCYVTWGVTPVAKSDGSEGRMIGASNPEYFAIEAGWKVAVIERT